MTDNSGQATPGWYPDPAGSPRQRYYDGEMWTDHYHDDAGAVAGMAGGAPGAGGYAAQGVGAEPERDPIGYWKKAILENYANFSGRARRAEYWWTTLINFVISIVLSILAGILGDLGAIISIISLLFSLAIIIPGIAMAIRRLHDTGRSGWWLLIGLIPLIGFIVLIVFMASDSHRGANQYGPSPKYGG